MIETGMVKTPVGLIQIRASQDALMALDFVSEDRGQRTEDKGRRAEEGKAGLSPVIAKALNELEQYFSGKRTVFTVPYVLEISPFQKKVLERMRAIPFGKTMTYGELTQEVGGCPQAIGQVCRRNPLPIIIPCHRVVGAKDMGGFCGGLDEKNLSMKSWLLNHEQSYS